MLVGSACSQPAGDTAGPAALQQQDQQQQSAVASPSKCAIATPTSWQRLIAASTVHLPGDVRAIPFATGTSPDRFFAEVYSPTFSGVAAITAPAGNLRRIHAFANPATDQAYAGEYDGRWLVWIVQRSLEDWNDWEIWAWDSTTDRTFQIAAAPRIDGHTIPGPVVEPVVNNGIAAWIQANGAGFGDVHVFALQDRHDSVVDTHATTPVAFWGSNLLWMHLDVAAQSGHFEMVDRAGHTLVVSSPLASVTRATYVAISPNLVAWTDGHSLWTYRPGQATPSLALQTVDDSIEYIGIAGDLITWDGQSGPAALDTRSSTVTSLTPANGGRFASGNSLLIYWPVAGSRSGGGSMAVADVDASRLPVLPGC